MLVQLIFSLIWFIHTSWSLSLDIRPDQLDDAFPWPPIMRGLFVRKALGGILKIIKTFGGRQLDIYDNHCKFWTLEEFIFVRNFMLGSPKYSHFLLTFGCYRLLSAKILEYHSPMAEEDLNRGVVSSAVNPILKGYIETMSKFWALIEVFGPQPYYFSSASIGYGRLIHSDPDPDFNCRALFASDLCYIAVGTSMDFSKTSNVEKLLEGFNEYVKDNLRKDPSNVYKVLSSHFTLKTRLQLNKEVSQLSIDNLAALDEETQQDVLVFEDPSTWRLLYDSLRLCVQRQHYPYNPQHDSIGLAVQAGLQEINEIGLLKYAFMLTMVSPEPFETCRYFLGPENLKRLYLSPGLSLYSHARLCLTRDEFIINLRKWHLYFKSDYRLPAFLDTLEDIFQFANLLFQNMERRFNFIVSGDPETVIQDCTMTLIDILEKSGIVIDTIEGKDDVLEIGFDVELLKSDVDETVTCLRSLITFIIYGNFHYDYSIVLADDMLEGVSKAYPNVHSFLSFVYNVNLEKPTE